MYKTFLAFLILNLVLLTSLVFAQVDIGDIIFCIDASGSMLFPFPIDPAVSYSCDGLPDYETANSRYYIIKGALVAVLDAIGNNVAEDIESLQLRDGRVAMLRFPGRLQTGVPPENFILDQLLGVTVVNSPDQNPYSGDGSIRAIMNEFSRDDIAKRMYLSCNPNGTPMGFAIETSKTILDNIRSDNPGRTRPQAILLITDGENNREPYIDDIDWRPYTSSNIEIWAFGIGDETGEKYDDLQQIAKNTEGYFYAILSDLTTEEEFEEHGWTEAEGIWWQFSEEPDPALNPDIINLRNAIDNLFAGYLQYTSIIDPSGILQSHQIIEDTITVTPLDKSILISIHWNPYRGIFHPQFRLILDDDYKIECNSTTRTDGYRITRGFDYAYIVVHDTLIRNHYGNWKLQIDGSYLPLKTPYTYSIFTKSDLKLITDFNQTSFKTGDRLAGKLYIDYNGTKISGANGKAFVRRPLDWLGTWNNKQKLTADELDSVKFGNWENDMPLLSRKRIILNRNHGVNYFKRVTALLPKTFSESGKEYSYQIDEEINKPGLYEIQYNFNGNDTAGRAFQRQLFFHKYVSVKVDSVWKYSKIEFEKISQTGSVITSKANVIFKDKYGNIALPDMTRKIKINVLTPDGDTLKGDLIDEVNGTYSRHFTYDKRKGKPVVFVKYDKLTFPEKKVNYAPEGLKFTTFAGYFLFDKAIPINDGAVFGIRVPKSINNSLSFEGEIGFTPTKDKNKLSKNGIVTQMNINCIYKINKEGFRNFFTIGGGILNFQKFNSNDIGPSINFGYGLFKRLAAFGDLRFDLRDFMGYNLYDKKISHNMQSAIGFQWKF